MTHVINQGMAMYWGTSRWSAMEIMVSDRKRYLPFQDRVFILKMNRRNRLICTHWSLRYLHLAGLKPLLSSNLLSWVETSDYLSFCWLPWSSLTIFLWALASIRHFSRRDLLLTGCFLFLTYSVKCTDGCVGKIPVDWKFLKKSTMPCSKKVKSPFFLIVTLSLNFSW